MAPKLRIGSVVWRWPALGWPHGAALEAFGVPKSPDLGQSALWEPSESALYAPL